MDLRVQGTTLDWRFGAAVLPATSGRLHAAPPRSPPTFTRSAISTSDTQYDREKLQERLAKLVGGVAVIKVGSATETEMKEKNAPLEDAMHATKAAVDEGIVAGAGVALLRAGEALISEIPEETAA